MFYMCKQVILLACLSVTMIVAREVPLSKVNANLQSNGDQVLDEDVQRSGIFSAFKSFKNLPPGMPSVLLVTALTWLSWFPFIFYDTDWMGREVYHSYHGSHSFFTTQIGWDEKFTMGIQMDRMLRLMLMTEGLDKVHLVCY